MMKNARRDKDEEKRDKESRGRANDDEFSGDDDDDEERGGKGTKRTSGGDGGGRRREKTRKRRKKREDDTEAHLESGLETAVGAVRRNDKDAGRALEIIIAKADEAAEVGTEEAWTRRYDC